jgi:hypothetical protein
VLFPLSTHHSFSIRYKQTLSCEARELAALSSFFVGWYEIFLGCQDFGGTKVRYRQDPPFLGRGKNNTTYKITHRPSDKTTHHSMQPAQSF